MTEPSGCDSNNHRGDFRVLSAEHSYSSQESTNHANLSTLPGCSKGGENNKARYQARSMVPDADQEEEEEEEEENVPLSGKPYFTSILAKSQVQGPYQMVIPSRFYSFLPTECVPVILSYRKKNWEMRYYGDRSLRRFDSGWKHFAVDNNLQIGDACILQLMDEKNLKFEVQILRGDIPEEFAVHGQSSDSPIVIE